MDEQPYLIAQKAIISLILAYGRPAMDILSGYVEEQHFTTDAMRAIWRSVYWLYNENYEINDITVQNSMSVQRTASGNTCLELLDPVNGRYRETLLEYAAFRANESLSHLRSYMDIILDKYVVNKYLTMAEELLLVSRASENNMTAGQCMRIANKYSSAYATAERTDPMSLQSVAENWRTREINSDGHDQIFMQMDIHGLNDYVYMTPGNMTVIGADTSEGKTSLALQGAWNIARQKKKLLNPDTYTPVLDEAGNEVWVHRRVLYCCPEMSREEILGKLACQKLNIPFQEFIADWTMEQRIEALRDFADFAQKVAPFFFIDDQSITTLELGNQCKKLSSRETLDLVVVDHALLFEPQNPTHSVESDVRKVVDFCKLSIAKRLHTHVIVISQLNKAIAANGVLDQRPKLTRLFGSSAIQQHASIVLLLYREHRHEKKDTIVQGGKVGTYFLNRVIIAKNRLGSPDLELVLGFVPYLAYFVSYGFMNSRGLLDMKTTEAEKYRLETDAINIGKRST